mgnify:FL=1
MKIIIVGCGKVGYAIAGQLTQEKHDIVMVDNEIAHLSRADSTMDVMLSLIHISEPTRPY